MYMSLLRCVWFWRVAHLLYGPFLLFGGTQRQQPVVVVYITAVTRVNNEFAPCTEVNLANPGEVMSTTAGP